MLVMRGARPLINYLVEISGLQAWSKDKARNYGKDNQSCKRNKGTTRSKHQRRHGPSTDLYKQVEDIHEVDSLSGTVITPPFWQPWGCTSHRKGRMCRSYAGLYHYEAPPPCKTRHWNPHAIGPTFERLPNLPWCCLDMSPLFPVKMWKRAGPLKLQSV